jgi:ribosomal protein S17
MKKVLCLLLTIVFCKEHCIEILRQSVMCRGDTTLITFHWGHRVKLPQPDFTLPHQCVDWGRLMKWAEKRAIDVFEKDMLVHPVLGKSMRRGAHVLADDSQGRRIPGVFVKIGRCRGVGRLTRMGERA